jgi:hypothetical protein
MAKEVSSHKGPGDPGSQQGQIKTPMCDENVSNKGGGRTHSYAGTFNANAAGGSKGTVRTDDKIEGPGQKNAEKYPRGKHG